MCLVSRIASPRSPQQSGLDIPVPGLDGKPFARSEGSDLMALRREFQAAPALFASADSQISDCCLHREALR